MFYNLLVLLMHACCMYNCIPLLFSTCLLLYFIFHIGKFEFFGYVRSIYCRVYEKYILFCILKNRTVNG